MKEIVVQNKNHLIALGGPTGVGKTSVSIEIAQYFDTDIISADSRQLYKEMEIGTAKPDKEKLNKVKHYFINHLSIHESFNVGQYERECLDVLSDLFEIKENVLMVGGTGLYFNAIINGLDDFPEVSLEIKQKVQNQFNSQGIEALQQELKEKDPVYYNQVDFMNPHRLIRALSVIESTGEPFSSFLGKKKVKRNFSTIQIMLNRPREELYQRINQRVRVMMESGLLEEVKTLYKYKSLPSLNTVGYNELFSYLDGDITLEEAISLIQRNSRRYAKRQITWFTNQGKWQQFHPDNIEEIIKYINTKI